MGNEGFVFEYVRICELGGRLLFVLTILGRKVNLVDRLQ